MSSSRFATFAPFARFARFARNVWNVTEAENRTAAQAGIEMQTQYFRSLGMPTTLPELGFGVLDEAALIRLTTLCTYDHTRTIGAFRVLDGEAIYRIYAAANGTLV